MLLLAPTGEVNERNRFDVVRYSAELGWGNSERNRGATPSGRIEPTNDADLRADDGAASAGRDGDRDAASPAAGEGVGDVQRGDATPVTGVAEDKRSDAQVLAGVVESGSPSRDRAGPGGAVEGYATLLEGAARYWPASELSSVWAIDGCESTHGTDPRTYDLGAENGGRLQLNRSTWEDFFWLNYGWTWDQVVNDLDIHLHAAFIVWQRAGNSWSPWACKSVLK